MRAALLLGPDRTLKAWEYEALELAIESGLDVTTVLHCTNDQHPPRQAKHAVYRALTMAGRPRMPMLRDRDVTPLLRNDVEIIYFPSEWEGTWQRVPADVAEQLQDHDVVVKFGMNLLKGPEDLPVTHGVVAYHDANPEAHRGRPHGFHELASGEATMNVTVHQLSNTPNNGRVLAEAYSRVVPTSYRSTLNNAYETSVPLLAKAIGALKNQSVVPNATPESNHQLPTNGQVVKTLGKMATALVGRGLYGAFREKRWNVAFVPQPFDPENPVQPQFADMQPITLPEGYTFAADPCAYHNGRLYVEVMHGSTGKGEIFAYTDGQGQRVDLPVGGGHLSYPQILEYEGVTYLFPEMGDVGPPTFFELDEEQLTSKAEHQLIGLEDERVIDPTMIEHEGHWYLFGGRPENVGERLELWVSDSPFGPWTPHLQTPVCLDPRSARMAGPLIRTNGKLYRTGQDGSVSYGRGVTISRIEKLTPTEFGETRMSSFTIQGAYGPHTILPTEDGYWLDYYTEQTTPMAGVRRVKGRLK
ncbi:glucosamine inositolphosphorylceramide transferase family protein [Enteractinococcus coprophilus]|uniref:Glucosamine inositolphosphorylceramide transferase 1 N-terminal domain-containing protein n=1 Tax=Enteractinococcus coprophilus TaxID=1027633 RepID=A0A543AGH6_9MICC|nr:hypothetical protein [Enteractinococcus coprophilus]TQL71683.1 hypothetical protein FB556_2176 [Enteractinococcus coprophilus]